MKQPPYVSVIINTFNYGQFIEQAVDSVLAQGFPESDMEIIVVDDGSTDDTPSKLEPYGNRITRIRKENGGQASALNSGLGRAQGQVIALLDSDDYWMPDKLKIAADYFRKNDEIDIFYHNLQIVDAHGSGVRPYFKSIPPSCIPEYADIAGLLNGVLIDFPPTSAMVFRKKCLETILPIPEHYDICADTYLHYFSYLNARKTLFVPDRHGYYRIHGENYFENQNGGNKFRHLTRIYPLLIDDLLLYGKKAKLDFSALVRTIQLLIEYWKIEQKISALPPSKRLLYFWYDLKKLRLFIYRVLKGNRARRIMKFYRQNILRRLPGKQPPL